MLTAESLFDLGRFAHSRLFREGEPVWSGLRNLKTYMNDHPYPLELMAPWTTGVPLPEPVVIHRQQVLPAKGLEITYGDTTKGGLLVVRNGQQLTGATVIMAGAILIGDRIKFGQGTLVEGGATIKAPAIIGNCTEVRQGAYLRGYCLVGDRCVVGHATEVKHSIFLDDAKAGHFAYLGDSILGNDTNLGAGTKFANLKFTPGNVRIAIDGVPVDTAMRKFGAILGDHAQTGCNSVTNPGTIIGRNGVLMPNVTASPGYHPDRKRIR